MEYCKLVENIEDFDIKNFTIDSKLPDAVQELCEKKADEITSDMPCPEIIVDPKPSGQAFVVLSIIGPNCRQKSDTALVQILGCHASHAAAVKFAQQVSGSSPDFDIFVADMYKWLPLNAKPEDATNTHWQNKEVDTLMAEYNKRREISKNLFDARRTICIEANRQKNAVSVEATKSIDATTIDATTECVK